jgi:ribosomal protein S18 acetylase RimI-like enzyme
MPMRLATAAECDAITALVRAAYSGYVPRIGREPAPMVADYAALIAAGRVQVLEEADALLGVLVLIPGPDALLLENIAVTPAMQGRGVGRMLLGVVEAEARRRGLPAVRLYTNAAMVENIALYRRVGYVETGRDEQDGFRRVFMTKWLDAAEEGGPTSAT